MAENVALCNVPFLLLNVMFSISITFLYRSTEIWATLHEAIYDRLTINLLRSQYGTACVEISLHEKHSDERQRPERLPNSLVLQTTLVRISVLWSRGVRGSRNVPPGQNVSLHRQKQTKPRNVPFYQDVELYHVVNQHFCTAPLYLPSVCNQCIVDDMMTAL